MRTILATTSLVLALALGAPGCKSDPEGPDGVATVLLDRRPGGRYAVELVGAPQNARALQVELTVDGAGAYVFEDVAAAAGLGLDTVRLGPRGANRAILFVGDKRGVRLPRSGDVATFVVRADGNAAAGRLSAKRVVLAGDDGAAIPVELGPALVLR